MLEKYQNKYRVASHRKPNWNYSADALYFLTIVTQGRDCSLGEIKKKDGSAYVQLSDFGKIVADEWFKSFEIRNELFLHEFVIMPNHIHTIVEICQDTHDGMSPDRGAPLETHGRRDTRPCVSTEQPINPIESIKHNPPIRLPKSIASFIAGFKSAVNKKIDDFIDEHQLNIHKYNRHCHFFQPNYYDHIIKNHREYLSIANYIINNPENWEKDKLYGKI